MNTRLLRAVIEQIRSDPCSLFMGVYQLNQAQAYELMEKLRRSRPISGRVGCIYGLGLMLTGQPLPEDPHPRDVGTLFEISEEQALSLAFPWSWPEPFIAAYHEANNQNDVEKLATVAITRIEHFIETGQ